MFLGTGIGGLENPVRSRGRMCFAWRTRRSVVRHFADQIRQGYGRAKQSVFRHGSAGYADCRNHRETLLPDLGIHPNLLRTGWVGSPLGDEGDQVLSPAIRRKATRIQPIEAWRGRT